MCSDAKWEGRLAEQTVRSGRGRVEEKPKQAAADIEACKRVGEGLNIIPFCALQPFDKVVSHPQSVLELGEAPWRRMLRGTRWLVATGLVSTWRGLKQLQSADCPGRF